MKFFTPLTMAAKIPEAALVAMTEQTVPALAVRIFRLIEQEELGFESA
jgi:hypothetical protein